MKKLLKNIKQKLTILCGSVTSALILAQSKVYAASGTESIDSFINFACDWLTKIRWCHCISRWCNVCTWLAT